MEYRIVLSSKRLYVRTWLEEDAEALFRIMRDARMHTYTPEEPWTMKTTREVIQHCKRHKLGWEVGYFNCPLFLKENDELIGRVGLNLFDEAKNLPEIEWTIAHAHWGKGYASEIGREILRYGFEEAGFESIIGFTSPEHAASCRVMRKIGMRGPEKGLHNGREWSFFRIEKGDHY